MCKQDEEESMKSLMLRLVAKKEEKKKMVKKIRKLARVALNLLCLLTSISQLEIHEKDDEYLSDQECSTDSPWCQDSNNE